MEALQANHQFTPDAIGFIILYLLEGLTKDDQLDVFDDDFISYLSPQIIGILLNKGNWKPYKPITNLHLMLLDLSSSTYMKVWPRTTN